LIADFLEMLKRLVRRSSNTAISSHISQLEKRGIFLKILNVVQIRLSFSLLVRFGPVIWDLDTAMPTDVLAERKASRKRRSFAVDIWMPFTTSNDQLLWD